MIERSERLYEVFVAGTHDEIAVFGPASGRTSGFCATPEGVHTVVDATDLRRFRNEVPLVLLPLWWKETNSPAVISAARSSGRKILAAYPS